MEKSPKLARNLIIGVVILALLSLGGNALVIWYVKQNASHPYDDSHLTARLDQLEAEISGISVAVTGSNSGTATIEAQISELRSTVDYITERVASLDNASLIARLEQLEAEMRGVSVSVASSMDSTSDLSTQLSEISSALTQITDRVAGLEGSLAQLLAEISTVPASTETLQSSLAGKLDELALQLRVLGETIEDGSEGEPVAVPVLGSGRIMQHVEGGVRLVIIPGDTIWDLARRFENPPSNKFIQSILDVNGITDPRKLRIGQSVVIPTPLKP